jgi:hypothetical protein
MGRKRNTGSQRHVTGKEGAVFLDDWLDEPEDDYIDFENNPCLFRDSRQEGDAQGTYPP